jgi:hypothetical protein
MVGVIRMLALSGALGPCVAAACPTCACGNPAMTSMGAEQPYANRVRLGATLRAWQQETTVAGPASIRLRELRLDLSASWSPTAWFTLAVNLPVQGRELQAANLERETALAPGELELFARAVVFGAGRMRPAALISILAGVRLPSAPILIDQEQRPLSLDAQLGAGSVTPQLGVSWSGFFGDRWSGMASLVGELSVGGRFGFQAGPAGLLVALAQYQPLGWLGVRGGIDARLEGVSRNRGQVDDSQSGFLGSLLADLVFRPTSRLLILAGARVPVLDARLGSTRTLPILTSSLVVDL